MAMAKKIEEVSALSTPLRELDSLILENNFSGKLVTFSFNSPEGIRLIDTRGPGSIPILLA